MDQSNLLRQLPDVCRRYVWSKRVGDFAALAAIPLFGFFYGARELSGHAILAASWLALVSLLMMIHIFSLNDWADYFDDRSHDLRSPLSRRERNERLSLLTVALSSAALLFPMVWLVRPAATVPAAAIVLCSALYSCRWRIRGKETMLLSSLLHVVCGALYFMMGFIVASGSSAGSNGIAIFLGLSTAAGHINQEISDHREDLASHIRTYSTVLGPTSAFLIGQFIFAAAFVSLHIGMRDGWASLFGSMVILMWLINLALATWCCWKRIDPESVERYRFNYRILYLFVGFCVLLRAPLFRQ